MPLPAAEQAFLAQQLPPAAPEEIIERVLDNPVIAPRRLVRRHSTARRLIPRSGREAAALSLAPVVSSELPTTASRVIAPRPDVGLAAAPERTIVPLASSNPLPGSSSGDGGTVPGPQGLSEIIDPPTTEPTDLPTTTPSDPATGAVPEPSTWAMFIVGMLVVAGSTRASVRRRRSFSLRRSSAVRPA